MPVTPFENSKYWRSTPSPMYSSPTPSLTRSIGSDNLAALASTLDYEQRMPVGAWPSQVASISNRIEEIKSTISSLETEFARLVDDLQHISLSVSREQEGRLSPRSDSSWSELLTPQSSPASATSSVFAPHAHRHHAEVSETTKPSLLSRDEIARSLAFDPILEGHKPRSHAVVPFKPQPPALKVVEPVSHLYVLQDQIPCFHCDQLCVPSPRVTRADNRNSNAGRPYVVHAECPQQINFLYFVDHAGWQGVQCECGLWCIPEGRQRHINPKIPSQSAICPKRKPFSCEARFERTSNGNWVRALAPPAVIMPPALPAVETELEARLRLTD